MQPGEKYDFALSETKRIIDSADPEGLLAAGAPPDEYESQAAELTRRLLHGEDLPRLLQEWYADALPRDSIAELVSLQQRLT